jgi:ribose 5-phosphate isomerase B
MNTYSPVQKRQEDETIAYNLAELAIPPALDPGGRIHPAAGTDAGPQRGLVIGEPEELTKQKTPDPSRPGRQIGFRKRDDVSMTASNRIVLSSDHSAIQLRGAIAAHIAAQGWEVVDIGPTTPQSTHYPEHGEAAARLVASGDCRFGVILCGTGQGMMMAANKVKGVRCGVCGDTFSARMIRQHNDANMLSIGARVVGEGLALDIVDAFLTAQFEGGRHATRVAMIAALEG